MPDPRIADEVGRSRAPEHAAERHGLRPCAVGTGCRGCTRCLPHGWPAPGRGKLNVSPAVNSQSGAPRLNPLLIPASTTALSQGGCQSTPRRPELLAACPWPLSPLISPTTRTVAPRG